MPLDLNIEDKNGWTPLHHAAKNNSVKVIEFLLDHGVDDTRLNKQNDAAVHVAVVHNQLKALEVRPVTNPPRSSEQRTEVFRSRQPSAASDAKRAHLSRTEQSP